MEILDLICENVLVIIVFIIANWAIIVKLKEKRKEKKKKEKEKKKEKRGASKDFKALIIKSDDFSQWEAEFIEATVWLISRNIFTLEDFKYNGGWVRKVNKIQRETNMERGDQLTYFMMPKENPTMQKIVYLDLPSRNLYYQTNGIRTYIRYKG